MSACGRRRSNSVHMGHKEKRKITKTLEAILMLFFFFPFCVRL